MTYPRLNLGEFVHRVPELRGLGFKLLVRFPQNIQRLLAAKLYMSLNDQCTQCLEVTHLCETFNVV